MRRMALCVHRHLVGALVVLALPLLAGCTDPIERLCRETPPADWPVIDTDTVYFDGAVWNPPGARHTPPAMQVFARRQLLELGLRAVELGWREEGEQRYRHAALHAVPGQGEVLRFTLGRLGDAACLVPGNDDYQAGLGPDECLAVERLARPSARWQVRAQDTTRRERGWWGATSRRERQLRLWIEHDGQAQNQPRFASAFRKRDLFPSADTGCEHYTAFERLRFDTLRPSSAEPRTSRIRELDSAWESVTTPAPVRVAALSLPTALMGSEERIALHAAVPQTAPGVGLVEHRAMQWPGEEAVLRALLPQDVIDAGAQWGVNWLGQANVGVAGWYQDGEGYGGLLWQQFRAVRAFDAPGQERQRYVDEAGTPLPKVPGSVRLLHVQVSRDGTRLHVQRAELPIEYGSWEHAVSVHGLRREGGDLVFDVLVGEALEAHKPDFSSALWHAFVVGNERLPARNRHGQVAVRDLGRYRWAGEASQAAAKAGVE